MRRLHSALLSGALALVACGESKRADSPSAQSLVVTLAHDTPAEAATRAQLLHLVAVYDVTPWLTTRAVVIDEQAATHSHPTLTMSAKPLADDELLAVFVQEEVRSYVDLQTRDRDAALLELRATYDHIPVGAPDGRENETDSYEQLLVGDLTWHALGILLGDARANRVFEAWARDHDRVLYRMVLNHEREITAIAHAHRLTRARRD